MAPTSVTQRQPAVALERRKKWPSPWPRPQSLVVTGRSDGQVQKSSLNSLRFAPNCAHGCSSQWQLEPSSMVSFRSKLRPDVPSHFLGTGRSFGHWQVFVRHHFFLAPNWAHGSLPHQVSNQFSVSGDCGGARMPATFFTKASSTKTKSTAIVGHKSKRVLHKLRRKLR